MEFEYTVGADEPESWAYQLEGERQSMLEVGYTEFQITDELARQLRELRAGALAAQQQSVEEAHEFLGISNGNGSTRNGHVDTSHIEPLDKPTLAVETWAEFRDHTDEEIDYLVEGLIAKGSLVFLASEPKAGKTWLALALAVSIASGTKYLDRFEVSEPSPVLYLALEGHRTDYRTRLGCIARGNSVNPDGEDDLTQNLSISYQPIGINLMDKDWVELIAEEVERTNAKVVFVDVLRDGAPYLREDGQGSGDFSTIKKLLRPLLKSGVTIVLVHHFSKRNESTRKRSIGEMMSGSGALFGAADLLMGITTGPKDWENLRVEFIGRSTPAPAPFRVQTTGTRTGKYGGFRYADSMALVTAAEDAEPKVEWLFAEKIATWIIDQGGRLVRSGELVSEFRVHKDTIAAHRDDLERRGIEYIIDPTDKRNSGYRPLDTTS
jgi:hypothetical protein